MTVAHVRVATSIDALDDSLHNTAHWTCRRLSTLRHYSKRWHSGSSPTSSSLASEVSGRHRTGRVQKKLLPLELVEVVQQITIPFMNHLGAELSRVCTTLKLLSRECGGGGGRELLCKSTSCGSQSRMHYLCTNLCSPLSSFPCFFL